MKTFVRKLTTKPVWWMETRRSYPIRDSWTRLPSLPAANGPITFALLTVPGTFNDALWAAWSWLRFLGEAVHLELYLDGTPTDEMRQSLEKLLPGSSLFEATDVIHATGGFSATLDSFIRDYPLGRKLGLYFALQSRGRFLYSDSDVLAFNRPTELLQILTTPNGGAHLLEENEGLYSPEIVERAQRIGVRPVKSLNAGLVLVPQNSLSLAMTDEFLRDWQTLPYNWFFEQTTLACLLSTASITPLPRDRYVVSLARQFHWQPDVDYTRIAARHFATPTRHVMYSRGLPWLLRNQEQTPGIHSSGTAQPR